MVRDEYTWSVAHSESNAKTAQQSTAQRSQHSTISTSNLLYCTVVRGLYSVRKSCLSDRRALLERGSRTGRRTDGQAARVLFKLPPNVCGNESLRRLKTGWNVVEMESAIDYSRLALRVASGTNSTFSRHSMRCPNVLYCSVNVLYCIVFHFGKCVPKFD